MEQKRVQKMLREQFGFRLFVFVAAGAGCIWYGIVDNQASAIWGIVLGIAASALVWALVELFDFFVTRYHQYCIERSAYIMMITRYLSKIRNHLSKEKEDISWEPIKDLIEELHEQTIQYPFSGSVYAASKEFEDFANYIERMQWRVYGCYWNLDSIEPESVQAQSLYDMFVEMENLFENDCKFIETLECLENEMTDLQRIEISFEKFEIPKYSSENRKPGTMWETVDVENGQRIKWSFKPQVDFLSKIKDAPAHGAFLTVLPIIFRKIS